MIRSLISHIVVACLAFIFTFFLTLGNNTLTTSFTRAIVGFFIFFILMFPVRWLWSLVHRDKVVEPEKGSGLNVQTPDEDLLKHMSMYQEIPSPSSSAASDFTPLSPPVLKKKDDPPSQMTSEDIANAIRVLSTE